ncbi:MFS transporter [Pseudalkalibacillus caeni]|uniref:MFS transporter n=1 Tax=Exobacillus caeni TaxID=2574798 RepID=A0A5R9FBL3_9BACL|nr:MFS transporter [Pseudalkalibacillus caeni]
MKVLKKIFYAWKYPAILLLGIGVSNIGAWIYLIAINLTMLTMTGSPLAVAALYVIKPLAALFTNTWTGSMIDRVSKRNLLVVLDVIRALLIAILPSLSSIWVIYSVVFLINIAGSVFYPASRAYITRLIPTEKRKRFNSLRSLIDSGAFLIGPAVAGVLFMIGTPDFAIYVNAVSLFLSGMLMTAMPDFEKDSSIQNGSGRLSFQLIKKDWTMVLAFSRKQVYIMLIYLLFSSVMVMTAALDSLEAAYSKEVLSLTDTEYGFLVSIAGAGIVVGAALNALVVKKLSTACLIGAGSLIVSVGYIVYAVSDSFTGAGVGFFVLSFALAFANTGFETFYQNNIPVELMGRVGSIYGLVEALLVIIATLLVGIMAQVISINVVVIAGSFFMLFISAVLLKVIFQPDRKPYYEFR